MSAQTRSDRIWNRFIAAFAGLVVITLTITGLVVLGGVGRRTYSQATPDDVVKSAILMVRNNDAHRLPDLVHADSDEMRRTLKRLGILMGHMQTLADAIARRFPDEIARYRVEAEDALAAGKRPALLGTLVDQLDGDRDGPPSADDEAAIRDLVARIFADPYAWIEQNEDRLSTIEVTDELASILVDGKPAAGVGLTLKLDADKWYLALPTNLPPVARIMPKAPEQWRMIDSLIKILDNTVLELTDDAEHGRLRNLKAIGDKAQGKALFPAGLWFTAYASDMDARRRIDRNLRQYRERQKAWATARAATQDAAPVSPKLLSVLNQIAPKEIEPQVRARKPVRWAELNDADFEFTLAAWVSRHKLNINLNAPLTPDAIDPIVAVWEENNRAAAPKKPRK